MKEIKHVITDPLGLHARPAGQLVKIAGKFKSDIQLGTPAKMANAKRILGVMHLTLKQGNELIINLAGEDEDEAEKTIKQFVETNL
jgi:phosphocarrier protein